MSNTSNPGCLDTVLGFFGLHPKRSPNYAVTTLPADPEEKNVSSDQPENRFPYRLRDDFLSPAEQSFYQVIKTMMGSYFTICPKVSLADIFFVVRPNENTSAYNRINRKHVDFLICDSKTMKPRFAIELDDKSHQRSDREERDGFVDGVFEAANLPLIHIPVLAAYNTAELGVLFKHALNQSGDPPQEEDEKTSKAALAKTIGQASLSSNSAPICPKCGVPMVLRYPKNNRNSNQPFYGCPNFPRCRMVLPVP